MSLEVVINFPLPDEESIVAMDTPAVEGPLTLVTAVGNLPIPPVVFPGIETTISLTTTSNASLASYTIVGEDAYGNEVEETLVGPNNTTVVSLNYYHLIYSITTNGAGAGIQISAGNTYASANPNGIGAYSMEVNGDHFRPNSSTSIRVLADTSGGKVVSYTVNQTLDDPLQIEDPDWFAITALDDKTDSEFEYLVYPWGGIQVVVGNTTTGSLRVGILQQGVRA